MRNVPSCFTTFCSLWLGAYTTAWNALNLVLIRKRKLPNILKCYKIVQFSRLEATNEVFLIGRTSWPSRIPPVRLYVGSQWPRQWCCWEWCPTCDSAFSRWDAAGRTTSPGKLGTAVSIGSSWCSCVSGPPWDCPCRKADNEYSSPSSTIITENTKRA